MACASTLALVPSLPVNHCVTKTTTGMLPSPSVAAPACPAAQCWAWPPPPCAALAPPSSRQSHALALLSPWHAGLLISAGCSSAPPVQILLLLAVIQRVK